MRTIKRKELLVPTEAGDFTIHRMRWGAAKDFLKLFAKAFKLVYGQKSVKQVVAELKASSEAKQEGQEAAPQDGQPVAQEGDFDLMLKVIEELLVEVDYLADFLVVNSSDITKEELQEIDQKSVFDLIGSSLKINIDDELKKSLAGIGAAAKALFPATKTT